MIAPFRDRMESRRSARRRAVAHAAKQGAAFGFFLAVIGLGIALARIARAGGVGADLPSTLVLLIFSFCYVVGLVAVCALLNATRARYASEFVRSLVWGTVGVVSVLSVGVATGQFEWSDLSFVAVGGAVLGVAFGYGVGSIQVTAAERTRSNE